jgi:hypothetical protein
MIVEKQMECRLAGKPKFSSEKTCSSATFVHHKIPHDHTRVWTRAVAVGSRRLIAWAMARPKSRDSTANYATNISFYIHAHSLFSKHPTCRPFVAWVTDMSSYTQQIDISFSEFYKTSYITKLCWIVTEADIIKWMKCMKQQKKKHFNVMWRNIYM